MEHDPDYLAWVNANCESPCPDGETKAVFSERVCKAFSALVDRALADGEETLVILAHGGTQMAAMERYALPHADYYHWCAPNAGGYLLDARDWAEQRVLHLVRTVQYTKEAARMIWSSRSGRASCWIFSLATRRGSPHPVVYMGRAISALEQRLRARLPRKRRRGELLGGADAGILPAGGHASC